MVPPLLYQQSMKKQTLLLISIIIQLQSAQATSQIYNPRLGSLEIDISSDLRFKIPISLHYSSRSLFDGFFGRGWCSSYDWKVQQRGQEYLFLQCEESRILKKDEYLKTDQLIILKNEKGFRTGFSEKTQSVIFSQRIDGNEIYILSKSHPNIVKRGPLLKNVTLNSLSFNFEYDEMDNLTHIKNLDKDVLVVNYDPRMDLLLSAQALHHCDLKLTYQRIDLTLKTTVTTSCPGQKKQITEYYNHFKQQKDSTLVLIRTEKIANLPEEMK